MVERAARERAERFVRMEFPRMYEAKVAEVRNINHEHMFPVNVRGGHCAFCGIKEK